MNAAAAAARFTAPTTAHPRRRMAPVAPVPADAAVWLTAHFDWSYGAVWVACEKFGASAETVVAWAEKVRAGGARAGLSTKERTWMLAQLTDPEQQPTAVERAMARTWARGRELASPVGPLTITNMDDAIALLEARLADDNQEGHDRTTRDGRELRTLLLDDLRVLRSERAGERRAAQAEEERSTAEMTTTTAATPETTHGPRGTVATEETPDLRDDKGYKIRPTSCLTCGKDFQARYYPKLGWANYCSPGCGAKGRYAHQTAQKSAGKPPATSATPAPTPTMSAMPTTVPAGEIAIGEPLHVEVSEEGVRVLASTDVPVVAVPDATDATDAATEADEADEPARETTSDAPSETSTANVKHRERCERLGGALEVAHKASGRTLLCDAACGSGVPRWPCVGWDGYAKTREAASRRAVHTVQCS